MSADNEPGSSGAVAQALIDRPADQAAPNLPVIVGRALAIARRLAWTIGDRLLPSPVPEPPVPHGDRFRIGFVVCDTSKWGLEPLLQKLKSDPSIDCGFYCTLSDVSMRLTSAERKKAYAETLRPFFAGRAEIWGDLYNPQTDRVASPGVTRSIIDCDLVFLQQPWGMRELPRTLAGRVACAYVHYGFEVIENDKMQFGLAEFHPYLWRHFVPSPIHVDAIKAAPPPRPPHVIATGHPKLDGYLSAAPARTGVQIWPHNQDSARSRVIYAPHHSVSENSLRLATFDWSAPAVLALVAANPQIDFVLRPHPLLGQMLVRSGRMTRAQWEEWLASWRNGANTAVSEDGPYMDMFRTSDLMITDSGAFLAEYLPTGQPLMRLVRPHSAHLNSFGKTLSDGFYVANNSDELKELFAQILLKGVDPLLATRQMLTRSLLPAQSSAATRIADEINSWAGRARDPKFGNDVMPPQ